MRVLRVMADEISLSTYDKPFPWTGINGTLEGQPADTLAFLAMGDGTGAIMLDGKMQDDATYKQAKVMMEVAELIASRDPEMKAAYGL